MIEVGQSQTILDKLLVPGPRGGARRLCERAPAGVQPGGHGAGVPDVGADGGDAGESGGARKGDPREPGPRGGVRGVHGPVAQAQVGPIAAPRCGSGILGDGGDGQATRPGRVFSRFVFR